jgi:hypothetical protein
LDGAAVGRIADRGVDALRVVVLDEFAEQSSQVVFTEDHHMVEKLSMSRSHEAFRGPVLPRTLDRGALRMDSEARERSRDLGREDGVVVGRDSDASGDRERFLAAVGSPIETTDGG